MTKCPNLSKILRPIRPHKANFFSVLEKNVFTSFIMKHAVCEKLVLNRVGPQISDIIKRNIFAFAWVVLLIFYQLNKDIFILSYYDICSYNNASLFLAQKGNNIWKLGSLFVVSTTFLFGI